MSDAPTPAGYDPAQDATTEGGAPDDVPSDDGSSTPDEVVDHQPTEESSAVDDTEGAPPASDDVDAPRRFVDPDTVGDDG